jgi:hypothetical protein
MVFGRREDRRRATRLLWREELVHGAPVLVNPLARAPGYRDPPDHMNPEFMVPGTRAELRAELLRLRTAHWVWAIAAISVSGSPLFVSGVLGFLN